MKRLLLPLALLLVAAAALILLRPKSDERTARSARHGAPLIGFGLKRGGAFGCAEEAAMGTRFAICVPRAKLAEVAPIVFAEVRRIEALASEWREASPLAQLNRAAGGGARPVPRELFSLIARGVAIGKETGGAFDISWAAMRGVWRFEGAPSQPPKHADVVAARELVDYRRIELNEKKLTARLPLRGMALGLGGIAKGYALDRAASLLRQRKVSSFLLSAGGQVLAGERGDRPWRVGIRHPRGAKDARIATLEARNTSVATSGDYERYYVHEGRRYHHIIDPRTGYPTRGLQSVTVVCRHATRADALSTALMVMGLEEGRPFVEQLTGVEAVFVTAAGEVVATKGLAGRLRVALEGGRN